MDVRRSIAAAFSWAACSLLVAACGGTPEEGQAGASTDVPKTVSRDRTLILGLRLMLDYDAFNPFNIGTVSQTGPNYLFEPLYYYNAYSETDNLIPWIAEGHSYNDDFSEVRISIRDGVKWSDGHPWTAEDLVFTINMLRENAPNLLLSTDMKTWVKEAVAVDARTAHITLTKPNPRFVFTYFADCFVNGVRIVPKHIWQGRDPMMFKNMDPAQGWPVVSGPYEMTLSTAQQRILDRRDEWWAASIGFQHMPEPERIVYVPHGSEAKWVQQLMGNEIDSCVDLRPANIKVVLDRNPLVTTWTGRDSPYGYLDWWPIALGFNNLEEPFTDPAVRRAINHAIDREQLVEIGWLGASQSTTLIFPDFPPMRRFTDQVQDLLDESQIAVHDTRLTDEIMSGRGWVKNDEGFWSKDGEHIHFVIHAFPNLFVDFLPILVQQLRTAGFDVKQRMTDDAFTQISQGSAQAFIMGHAGSVSDPYFTLRLYHSRFVKPTGTAAEHFFRWSNPEFDRIVDEMVAVDPEDPHLIELFRQAMRIWLSEMPSIPLAQWYHRIPHNEAYWKNWPTAENPYANSAYWHRTWLLVLLGLERAQTG